jgi:Kef-type K+ transport system membrane component KefB
VQPGAHPDIHNPETRRRVTDFPILQSLGYILFTAAAAVLLLRLARVPSIVAYMAAGLLLGPIAGVLTPTDSMELISEAGIALLLFLVGMELSLEKIRGVGRVALIGGVIQMAVCGVAGALVAMAFGLPPGSAMIIALAVTFSSTVVVVKMIGAKRDLSTLYGRIAVGILLVQDVAVALALTLFAGLRSPESTADVASVLRGVGSAFGGMFVLAAAAAAAARWVLPRIFAWIRTSPETVFIWSLAWCFLFILAAEAMHVSVELGAFIAGVGLAQLHFAEEQRRRVQPLVNFFLVVFFVSLGLQMRPGSALEQWPLLLGIMATVMILKPAVLFAAITRLGYGSRTAFLSSITLAQMSEFSFILAAVAVSTGALPQELLSVITLAGLITIAASSYLILWSERLYDRLGGSRVLALLGRPPAPEPESAPVLANHIVVIGMNTLGVRLVRELVERGENVIAIDTDGHKLRGLPALTIVGSIDDSAVLDEANYTQARLVVSALQIEDSNNLLAYRCRTVGVPVSIHAFDPSLIDDLRELGANHIMVPKYDGTRELALQLRQAGVLD